VEGRAHLAHVRDPEIGWELTVQGMAEPLRGPMRLKDDPDGLAAGVDAGIGASGAGHTDRCAVQSLQG